MKKKLIVVIAIALATIATASLPMMRSDNTSKSFMIPFAWEYIETRFVYMATGPPSIFAVACESLISSLKITLTIMTAVSVAVFLNVVHTIRNRTLIVLEQWIRHIRRRIRKITLNVAHVARITQAKLFGVKFAPIPWY